MSPSSANLYSGQTQQFSASVSGSANVAVTWSITPAGVGSVSTTGLYTTPSALQTVTVRATSVADPTKSASAAVSLSPLTISISPSSANRYGGQTQQFNASIQKSTNTNVTWSISPAGTGSISAAGLYTAPSAVSSSTTATVTATSAADPTKTISAVVSLSALTMSMSPQSANLNAGQTQQFSAQVNQNTITGVTWTISPTVGTISASGLYTAPAILGSQRSIIVTATSVADPTKSLSSTVTLLSPVSVSPASATLLAGQTQQFTATVTGLGNTAVTWSISPSVGSVSSTGLYTAPASIASVQTVAVIATSVSDTTKKASGTVTLNPPAVPVTVTVAPATATLLAAQTQQFTSTVTGSANTAVTWTISPAGTGTISTAGLYTAPPSIATQNTVTIKATSTADTTKSETATVTLNPPVIVTVAPATATLLAAQTQQFTSTVTGSANTAVTWTISPAGTGTVSATGLYTAPATISTSQTVTLTATSAADITRSASAVISLVPGTASPTISTLSPASGIVGTVVTITGSNFGASQGTSTITFNGRAAGTAISWSDTSILVVVPQGARAGLVVVTVNGTASNGAPFAIRPNISFLTPNLGPVGTVVTVSGYDFGASQGSSTVTFNGVAAAPASGWSVTSITVAAPAGASTGNVVVTVNGLASAGKLFGVPANVISVSPTGGVAGTQVTLAGSGFGAVQGTGSVWLGSTLGTVVSWSDTQVVATVAGNSTSGTARVQQGGFWSNPVSFSVTTATISSVSPASGLPGTQVTIAGSGFGAAQGTGQVWLGTGYGVVQSWSNSQIIAQVGAGAASGVVQVLQSGVWSATTPFTVNTISLTSVSPVSGAPGTSVTFTGSGFGATQGAGVVWLGSTTGQVLSWSDTTIVAAVATGAVTGIARIQQGTWSKAFSYTVPGSGGSVTMLTPNLLNMEVGDIGSVQALNAAGQPVTGLTWTSSSPTVVSLSTDNPPVLTALAAGRVTITAGGASADVTVSAGPMPVGTVIWSNPTAASYMVPAVPSSSGVADIFAIEGTSTIKAITKDGNVAWTANVNGNLLTSCGPTADFQGGLVVSCFNSIYKLDGLTGQAYPTYTSINPLNDLLIHPDGTIFNAPLATFGSDTAVIGIDPIAGTLKFSIPLPGSASDIIGTSLLGSRIIAGDGYAYFPYATYSGCVSSSDCAAIHVKLLRVNSTGASSIIDIMDTTESDHPFLYISLITNADTGVVLMIHTNNGFYIATTTGTSVSVANSQSLPGQRGPFYQPVQAQDGSFVGIAEDIQGSFSMVAFEANGNIRWSVPNDLPKIVTANGGVIGYSGITYDRNGVATGRINLSQQSWIGHEYQTSGSSIDSISSPPVFPAGASFWPQANGNPSENLTAVAPCPCLLQTTGVAPSPTVTDVEISAFTMNQKPATILPPPPPPPSYLILEGDPGENRAPGLNYNVGNLFHLAALTQQDALNGTGNLPIGPKRVSSVQDFAAQLISNGLITGSVIYFGHGAGESPNLVGTRGSLLAPGEGQGEDTNISSRNVNLLTNSQLAIGATITLRACYAGFGSGSYSIAQLIANRLQRKVFATSAGSFFAVSPNARHGAGRNLPNQKPIYLIPDGGGPLGTFLPAFGR